MEYLRGRAIKNYQDFTFPLNVYAHLLSLDYGGFEYLHYGIFEPKQLNLRVAQEHASTMLLTRLPSSPARILEVGIGIGTTLSRLFSAGHQVMGITPDAKQISYAKQIHGEELPVECSRLEEYVDAGFDCLVFQESAQYIVTSILFQKAAELLVDGGQMIIMDEMSLHNSTEPGLPSKDGYLEQAQANGFSVLESVDLSPLAGPTNSYILDAVSRYREQLVADLGVSFEQIDSLLDLVRLHDKRYRDGLYGYGLIHVQKQSKN